MDRSKRQSHLAAEGPCAEPPLPLAPTETLHDSVPQSGLKPGPNKLEVFKKALVHMAPQDSLRTIDATTAFTDAVRDAKLDLTYRSNEEPPLTMLSQRAVRGMVRRIYVIASPRERRTMLRLACSYGARLTAAQVAELL